MCVSVTLFSNFNTSSVDLSILIYQHTILALGTEKKATFVEKPCPLSKLSCAVSCPFSKMRVYPLKCLVTGLYFLPILL